MLEEVEERTYWALLESGMDSYDLDLTPAQRKEISDAIAIETGMTEEEIGKLAKLIQTGDSDLTLTPWGDIIGENEGYQNGGNISFQFFASRDKQFGKKCGRRDPGRLSGCRSRRPLQSWNPT